MSKEAHALKSITPIFTKLESLRDKTFDMSLDLESSQNDLSSLVSFHICSESTHSFLKNQFLLEMTYYSRYLLSIQEQLLQRKKLADTFREASRQKGSQAYWSGENERSLKDLRDKVRKMTKKQLRDFRIIAEEIS